MSISTGQIFEELPKASPQLDGGSYKLTLGGLKYSRVRFTAWFDWVMYTQVVPGCICGGRYTSGIPNIMICTSCGAGMVRQNEYTYSRSVLELVPQGAFPAPQNLGWGYDGKTLGWRKELIGNTLLQILSKHLRYEDPTMSDVYTYNVRGMVQGNLAQGGSWLFTRANPQIGPLITKLWQELFGTCAIPPDWARVYAAFFDSVTPHNAPIWPSEAPKDEFLRYNPFKDIIPQDWSKEISGLTSRWPQAGKFLQKKGIISDGTKK